MAEETGTTASNPSRDQLEARLERIENEYMRENRYWRGGLIAALVLVAAGMFFGGHHHHHRPPPMVMAGWAGGPGFAPPPPWAFEWHRPGGPGFGARGFGGCAPDGMGPHGYQGGPNPPPGPLGSLPGPMNGPDLQTPQSVPNG